MSDEVEPPWIAGLGRLWRMRTVPIVEAHEGRVIKIEGEVRAADGGLTAPVSRRPCVAYRVYVKERVPEVADETLFELESSCAFFVEDATGRALVQMPARLPLSAPTTVATSALQPSGDHLRALLEQHGHRSPRGLFHRDLHFTELGLYEGERVTVCGTAQQRTFLDCRVSDVYRRAATHVLPLRDVEVLLTSIVRGDVG